VTADGIDPKLLTSKAQIMGSGAYGWVTADIVVRAAEAAA